MGMEISEDGSKWRFRSEARPAQSQNMSGARCLERMDAWNDQELHDQTFFNLCGREHRERNFFVV
ncbi:hypothetical protein KC19_10G076100 [Ceratodon purpureus]|uniref:Uncharacterized protein n=1 Tax=Ceratodon purpureus TaxID=3225 RepID=A0A8T0GJ76_CERPU|nr:hypothetical protein KC19_10G076100 [Ceratodon purpureus]